MLTLLLLELEVLMTTLSNNLLMEKLIMMLKDKLVEMISVVSMLVLLKPKLIYSNSTN